MADDQSAPFAATTTNAPPAATPQDVAAPPTVADSIAKARGAGYGDGEIYSYLKGSKTYGGQFGAALKAGYDDNAIAGHYGLNLKPGSGRSSRAALPVAQAETLPPEEPGFFSSEGQALVSGFAEPVRQIAAAPSALRGEKQPQPTAEPKPWEQQVQWGDWLHPTVLLPKLTYQFAGQWPAAAGALALGAAGGAGGTAVAGPAGGVAGGAAGAFIGAALPATMASIAPYVQAELAVPGAQREQAVNRGIEKATQAGAFAGAGFAAFGVMAPVRAMIANAFLQAAQPGVEAAEAGKPVLPAVAEALPGVAAAGAVPAITHALGARLAGRVATGEAGATEPAPAAAVPRVRTPEEIENEDGIGPGAAQRVAAAEAVHQPEAAAATTAPAERADDTARQGLEQTAEAAEKPTVATASPETPVTPPEAHNGPPIAPEAAPAGPAAAAEAPAPLSAQAAGEGAPERAAPVEQGDRGEDLLAFLKRRGGIQPTGETRAMDAHTTRPGLVRKNGMAPDRMREAMEEAGFFGGRNITGDPTISDAYELLDSALRGQKVYGNNLRTIGMGPGQDLTGREEFHDDAAREEIRMAADEHGVQLTPEQIDAAARGLRGGQSPVAAIVAARLGEPTGGASPGAARFPDQGPATEDIPFGRRPPMPPQSGAPLLGVPERAPETPRQAEPTIRNDPRQEGLFPRGGEAVQAQAARDQAGPRGGQNPADEGLFAPKEAEQEPLFGRGPGTTPITAYHGSPHDFDRFDISKIGTGEGAQAYGHGLYFAEREGVARDYRDRLASDPREAINRMIEGGRDFPPAGGREWAASDVQPALRRHENAALRPLADNPQAVRDLLTVLNDPQPGSTVSDASIAAYRRLDAALPKAPGRLYETRLHLDPDKTLDWDKTLSQQPQGVREALATLRPQDFGLEPVVTGKGSSLGEHLRFRTKDGYEVGPRIFDKAPESVSMLDILGDRGMSAVENLKRWAGGEAAAARALKDAGIEGIRYLDQGSRAMSALSSKGLAEYFKPGELVMGYGGMDRVVRFHPGDPAQGGYGWSVDVREVNRAGEPVGPVRNHATMPTPREVAQAERERGTTFDRPQGTSNYVVFDDKLIDIERKYGRAAQARAAGEAPHPDAVRTAIDAARKIVGNNVRIETYDANHDVFRVRFPDGHEEQVFGYTLGRLLRAAIEPNRTGWNLNHEAVHALRALGVFNPGEWRTLEATARRGGWVEAENVPGRYPGLSEAQHLEEAIAERFARWTTEPRAAAPLIARLGGKIAAFFDRLRNALAGRGFRTADDVFGAMQRGDVGAREPAAGAPSMAESVGAARRFEAAQGVRGVPEPAMGRRDNEREFPAMARTRETMGIARRAADEVKQLFAPTSRGPEAKRAEHLIRASAAAKARDAARSTEALERFGHMIDRLPEAEQLAITDRREGGEAQPTTPLNEVINALRQQQDQWMRKVRSLGPEYLKTLRENYMGHIWANYPEWKAGIEAEEAAARERGEGLAQAQMRGKSPLKGSGAFLKQRTFDTQREGMDAGLIPVTTNPIEMQLLKLYEMQRFYHGVKLAEDMKNSGLAHWIPYNDEAGARASGWVKLDDTAFQPRVTEPGEYGRKEYGNWWAPEPVARVFNNYVSSGLAGHSAIYDAVRGAGNALNSAQLSMSGFHATFIAFDTMMSKLGLGIQQLSRGEPIRALGSMAQGLSPTAIFSTVRQGAMLRDAYLHPEQASPQMRKLVQALIAAGGRIAMDPFYRSTAAGSFVKRLGDLKQPGSILHDAWQMAKDTPVAAPMRIVGRLMDTLNEPLMGVMVPRAKLGVFADLASDFLRRNPEATEEQTAAAMTKAWDSVDNRMGQLVYDNLFWNKTAKDLAFITTRSVGWNLGSVREIGGAAVDLAAQGARTAKGLANVARGKPFGLPPEVTNRMAYVVGMTVISGLYGSILNYAMTGQGPQSLLDYFYPRTGSETQPGVPDRTTMPGYIKDVMAFKNDPLGTIGNKTQPLIETGIELAKNRDYYGGIIYMPGVDNPAVSYPEYLMDQAIPFSWRGWLKTREQGASSLTQALNFFGIQPGPKSITDPERGEAFQQRQDIKALRARAKENARGRISFGGPP